MPKGGEFWRVPVDPAHVRPKRQQTPSCGQILSILPLHPGGNSGQGEYGVKCPALGR